MVGLLAGLVLTATPLTVTDESLYRFGTELVAEGDYFRAIGEFKRLRFLSPDSPRAESALYEIGRCYLLANRYDEARASLLAYRAQYPSGTLADDALLRLGLSLLALGDRAGARVFWQDLARRPDSLGREAARATVISYLDALDVNQARTASRALNLGDELDPLIAARPHLKSTGLALGLSALVPGAGQAYGGRLVDGLVSLGFNLLSGFTLYQGIRAHDPALTGIGATLTFVFYAGGLYGGALAAKRYNDRAAAAYRSRLEPLLPEP